MTTRESKMAAVGRWTSGTVPKIGWGFALGVVANQVGVEVAAVVATVSTVLWILGRSWPKTVRGVSAGVLVVVAGLVWLGYLPIVLPVAAPRLELRLADGRPLNNKQRVAAEFFRKSGEFYEFYIGPFEMKEIGCRVETKSPVIRLFLDFSNAFSLGMPSEASDDKDFKTVFRTGGGVPIGACDRQTFVLASILSRTPPPPEISAALKVHYGPPSPTVVHFTIVLGRAP